MQSFAENNVFHFPLLVLKRNPVVILDMFSHFVQGAKAPYLRETNGKHEKGTWVPSVRLFEPFFWGRVERTLKRDHPFSRVSNSVEPCRGYCKLVTACA